MGLPTFTGVMRSAACRAELRELLRRAGQGSSRMLGGVQVWKAAFIASSKFSACNVQMEVRCTGKGGASDLQRLTRDLRTSAVQLTLQLLLTFSQQPPWQLCPSPGSCRHIFWTFSAVLLTSKGMPSSAVVRFMLLRVDLNAALS